MKKYYPLVIVFLVAFSIQSYSFSIFNHDCNLNPIKSDSPNNIMGNFSICLPGINTTQLTATGTPATLDPWVSLNTAVATVNNVGLVTAVSYGATTITFTDNLGISSSVNVYVSTFPTITSPSGTYTTCAGGTLQLEGAIFPNTVTPWSSSNPAIATIDNVGLVTGVSGGTCTITYKNLGGCTVTQSITIIPLLSTTITCGTWIPNQMTFNWNAVLGATTYTVAYTKNGGPLIIGTSGNILTFTLNNVLETDIIYIYVTPSGPVGSCYAGASQSCQDNVTTCLEAGSSGSISVCDSNTTVINLYDIITNEDLGGEWVRMSGTGGIFNASAGTFITSPGATTSSFMYMITGISTCSNDSSFATITVNQVANAGTLTGNQNICVGFTTTLTSTVIGGTWTTSNPTIATVNAATGLVTGISAGVATMTYTMNGVAPCGNEIATRIVTVNPSVSTNLFCDPTNVTSSNSVAFDWSNVPTATNYEYSYSINNNPYINGTTSVSHYEIFGVLPGQSVIFTLTNAVGVSCFQPRSTTCTNLANMVFETEAFQSFPNPVSNVLNLTNANPINNVLIVNSVGQQVLNQSYDSKSIQIDMSGLISGIYMVKLSTDNSTKTIKIIKD